MDTKIIQVAGMFIVMMGFSSFMMHVQFEKAKAKKQRKKLKK